MIVLLHGTGDDDSKPENWMKWIPVMAEAHGDIGLTVPGVGSGQQTNVASNAIECLTKIERELGPGGVQRGITKDTSIPLLNDAIAGAGGNELPPCATEVFAAAAGGFASAKDYIRLLGDNQRSENYMFDRSAVGIKLRIAVAGMVIATYVRMVPNPRPIRIIGHSRGGAAAVGLHNLCTLWGINCDQTLTLDPCHGQDVVGALKDYYYKIWKGSLYNIPCVKEVGDSSLISTKRPKIVMGVGATGTAQNHGKLEDIKHGHMGKTCSTKTTWRSFTSTKTQKRRQRVIIKTEAEEAIHADFATLKEHLEEFFAHQLKEPAKADKEVIAARVVKTLTDPAPPPFPPPG